MGPHGADRDIGRVLLRSPRVTSFPGRVISVSGEPVLVDHLVASRAGGFVIEERSWLGRFAVEDGHLMRSRSGPGGQWAKGAENPRVDRVRRIAEAVELRLCTPVEPVLVLTGSATTAFTAPVSVRGVTVMHHDHLHAWLDSLPDRTDQAGLAVLAARIERAFHASDDSRRTPSWKRDRQEATPRARPAIRPAPGPRDWTPYVQETTTGSTDPCAPRRVESVVPPRLVPRPERAGLRLTGLLAVAVVAFGVFALQDDGRRLKSVWDGAIAWGATVNRPSTGFTPTDQDAMTVAEAQPPAAPPPVAQPLSLTSCRALTAVTMTRLLGQNVYLLPSDDPLACHFGPVEDDSTVMWVSVALGPGSAERTLDGVNGTHTVTPGVGFTPTGGGGRAIATQVSVAMDAALYPTGSPGPSQLFDAVMRELVDGHVPAPQA